MGALSILPSPIRVGAMTRLGLLGPETLKSFSAGEDQLLRYIHSFLVSNVQTFFWNFSYLCEFFQALVFQMNGSEGKLLDDTLRLPVAFCLQVCMIKYSFILK